MSNRKEVVLFSDAMEHKLRLKDYKGGWHDIPLDKLFQLLQGEVQELKDAVAEGNTFDIMAEAADVGNYAMMIMDNAIRRITNGESNQTDSNQKIRPKNTDGKPICDNCGEPIGRHPSENCRYHFDNRKPDQNFDYRKPDQNAGTVDDLGSVAEQCLSAD